MRIPVAQSTNKTGTLSGGAAGPEQIMYGIDESKVVALYASKIMHTILNITTRWGGELGTFSQITKEFNALYSFEGEFSNEEIFK
jgi:hypothetical protein